MRFSVSLSVLLVLAIGLVALPATASGQAQLETNNSTADLANVVGKSERCVALEYRFTYVTTGLVFAAGVLTPGLYRYGREVARWEGEDK